MTVVRRHVYPQGHWALDVPIPYSMGVRFGELIALSGQVDMQGEGLVCHAHDLQAQTRVVIDHIRSLLEELDARLRDLTKLVVFYATDGQVDEDAYRSYIGQCLGSGVTTALTLVPLRYLAYPGMMVEIDAYAMCAPDGTQMARSHATVAGLRALGNGFCHGVRCGELTFVSGQSARDVSGQVLNEGDLVSQNARVLEAIAEILATLGIDADDVVKLNTWRAATSSPEAFDLAARSRFSFFAQAKPVATGIPVPRLWPAGNLILMDVWAMRGRNGDKLTRKIAQPPRHWDWSSATPYSQGQQCGDLIFVGGQAALDTSGSVLHADEVSAQTATTMDYVKAVLAAFDADPADILKIGSYYRGSDDPAKLHANVEVRNRYFQKPGPASTGVPVDELAYQGLEIEIDAIAARS